MAKCISLKSDGDWLLFSGNTELSGFQGQKCLQMEPSYYCHEPFVAYHCVNC